MATSTFKLKFKLLFILVFIPVFIVMCQSNDSELKLDLSQPNSLAEVFVKALVNNDTTLFNRLVINEEEFENFVAPWRSIKGNEGDIKQVTRSWKNSMQQFREKREEAIWMLQNKELENTKYKIMNTDIDPEPGFIEFDFEIRFESNERIYTSLVLIETNNKMQISEDVSPSTIARIKNAKWKILGFR